jgi:hypothetical protein
MISGWSVGILCFDDVIGDNVLILVVIFGFIIGSASSFLSTVSNRHEYIWLHLIVYIFIISIMMGSSGPGEEGYLYGDTIINDPSIVSIFNSLSSSISILLWLNYSCKCIIIPIIY